MSLGIAREATNSFEVALNKFITDFWESNE